MKNKKNVNTWFSHISGKKINEEKNDKFIEYRRKWREWPNSCIIGDFPLFLDIEVTNACNLRCPFCETTISGMYHQKGFISKNCIEKILDEGANNGLYGVKFNIRGEPLLHPLIDDFVRYAKEKGMVDVYFNTNAVLLTESMINRLIEAGLDRISISFEGHTKDIYEKNRVCSNYDLVLKNIENLRKIKEKLGVKYPFVRIQTIKLPEIDIKKYENFWKTRVDEVACLEYQDMTSRKEGIVSTWRCPQLWQRMAVLWNGDIWPCNHDHKSFANLGNIEKISIKDSWNSETMNHYRNLHLQGLAHKIKSCNGCYLRDSEISRENKGE